MSSKKFNRIFLIVTDSLGIGSDNKQDQFGDKNANTLFHVTEKFNVEMPTWKKLGIGHIAEIANYKKKQHPQPLGYVARVHEMSNAKDTLAGHWEMMGVETKVPSPDFTENGFPPEMVTELEKAFDGKKIIGNREASGTVILQELGQQSIDNDEVIIYTSADSTLQICGHETYMGLDNLYRYSKAAREIASSRPEWNVARIIARPFVGENGNWTRTFNRHDYGNKPPHPTVLDALKAKGIEVIAIGKINDIFSSQGITKVYPPASDNENMDIAIEIANENTHNQLIFVNLVEFDSSYGHRRDVEGYAQNIANFDIKLTKLVNSLKEDDLLIITSDHGNDPTFPGFNHTREALPLTIYSKAFVGIDKNLGIVNGLGTVGNIIARNFDVETIKTGEDIFDKLF
ncbi:phosphopentomutase [Candidatus Mycoplasma pogonae]